MIADSAARLASTLLALLQTRIELAATEVEEEAQHYVSCLLMSLAALFCGALAILLAALLLVVLYWDSHRVGVLLALTALFAAASTLIGLAARGRHRVKPKLLTHTMNELARDADLLQPPA